MNVYTAITIWNVSLVLLTGFSIYYTGSLWSILILLFVASGSEDDK